MCISTEGLINEIEVYSNNLKAMRVYKKCINAKKYDLANSIKIKYNIVESCDDVVDAMLYSIQYANLISNKCT